MVAKNQKLSPSMVKILLSDTSQTVKDALNFNPNLPQANKNASLNIFRDYEGLMSTILSPSPESKKMQKMRIELKNYGIDTADRSVILGALSQDPDFLGLKFEIRDYSEGPCLRITWEHIVLRKVGAYNVPGENGEVMVGNPLASRDTDFCGHISGKVAKAIL